MTLEPLAAGVWQILPTPFRGRERSVDQASLQRVIRHAGEVGVTGVVALGVLGEGGRLATGERATVLKATVSAAGDMPVVAGLSAMATAPAVEQAKAAADCGAQAVMLLVNSASAPVLAEHARAVSTASGLGVVFQDHPATSGIAIRPDALAQAISESAVGVAVKAEAPPTVASVSALRQLIDLPVFGGLGGIGLLDEMLVGSAGAMTGFAFPEALVRAVSEFRAGGFSSAHSALQRFLPLMLFEAQQPVSLAIRKELLRRRGLIDEALVREPGVSLPDWALPLMDAHLSLLAAGQTNSEKEE